MHLNMCVSEVDLEKTKEPLQLLQWLFCRAESRTRTGDLFITNELLYQLSYFGVFFIFGCKCNQSNRYLKEVLLKIRPILCPNLLTKDRLHVAYHRQQTEVPLSQQNHRP